MILCASHARRYVTTDLSTADAANHPGRWDNANITATSQRPFEYNRLFRRA